MIDVRGGAVDKGENINWAKVAESNYFTWSMQ